MQNEVETEISLSHLFDLIKKNILFLIIFSLIGGGVAYGFTKLVVKAKYTSSVKLFVFASYDKKEGSNSSQDIAELNYAQKVVKTYIQMLQTNVFFSKVAEASELNYTPQQLKSMVTFTILDMTEVFQVNVVTGAPQESKLIADTIAKTAPDIISSIQENAKLKIVDPATLPNAPSSPNVMLNTLIGVIVGLGLSAFSILISDFLDTTVKGEKDLIETYEIPVLACIPDFDEGATKKNQKEAGE